MLGVTATMVLVGCYASTEPATDVGPDSATLRAHGTANNGEAVSSFRYWVTGRVTAEDNYFTTQARHWPPGSSGPISDKASGLAAGTSYSFTLCGQDVGGPQACAQTRTFTTKAAVEDAARGGFWAGCCSTFSVDAESGPSGENPRGTMRFRSAGGFDPVTHDFTGFVTCLAIHGTRAAVGAVGQTNDRPPGTDRPTTMLVVIEDGRTAEDSFARAGETAGSTPPDCAAASAQPGQLSPMHEFVVNDAQP